MKTAAFDNAVIARNLRSHGIGAIICSFRYRKSGVFPSSVMLLTISQRAIITNE
jgi:hypothetical protein